VLEILYSIWIRIDNTLPWIELKGEYETRKEARQAARIAISRIAVKLVNTTQKRKPTEALVAVRARS
jgi:hypothetical protein